MKTQGQFLKQQYLNLKETNPNFSQRSFAKFLDLQPPRLHDFMKDKRIMTSEMAENVAAKLGLEPKEKQSFFDLVEAQRSRAKPTSDVLRIPSDQYKRISDWYFFAILALADTIDFQSTPEWVSQRLNISIEQATKALQLLVEIGLLAQNANGLGVRHRRLEADSKVPGQDMLKLQKQSLARVLNIVDDVPASERELRSITFAGDPNQMKRAKQMIQMHAEKLVARLESGCRTQVYELSIQLVPISVSVDEQVLENGSKVENKNN